MELLKGGEYLIPGIVGSQSEIFPNSILPMVIDKKQLRQITNISYQTWWRMERAGEGNVPPRIRLSSGRVGWKLNEVLEWIASRESI